MATSINLSREDEKRLDFLASQTGRTKEFTCKRLSSVVLKILKTITWLQVSVSVFAKVRNRCTLLPM